MTGTEPSNGYALHKTGAVYTIVTFRYRFGIHHQSSLSKLAVITKRKI